jgi:hypothetical protein
MSVFFRIGVGYLPVVIDVSIFATSRRYTRIIEEPLQIEGFWVKVTERKKEKDKYCA